jgi:hypothetical protein
MFGVIVRNEMEYSKTKNFPTVLEGVNKTDIYLKCTDRHYCDQILYGPIVPGLFTDFE